jgi:hypothetical protein
VAWAIVASFVGAGCSAVLGIQSDRHLVTVDAGTPAPPSDDSGPAPPDASGDDTGPVNTGGPDWSCLDKPPPAVEDASVELKILLNDVSGTQTSTSFLGTPIPGAQIRWCDRLDVMCSSPLGNATSDDAGVAIMQVPGAFDGYYEVQANSFTPSILRRSAQRMSETAQQGMANAALLAVGGSLAGVNADSDKSIAIVTAADCASNPAPGVTFQVGQPGSDETIVYIQNGLPSKSATETDVSGSAVVFNVPAGDGGTSATMTLTGTIAASGKAIRTVVAIVRLNWVTFVQVRSDSSHYPPP